MAGVDLPFAEGGHGGEIEGGLGDEVAGIGLDLHGEAGDLLSAGVGADQHAVTSRLSHRLHHQLLEVGEHIGAVVGPGADVGLHILDDGLLIEVITNDVPGIRRR